MASNESESDDQRKKTCQTDPTRRKKRVVVRDDDTDEEQQLYHLVMFECDQTYSVAKDENVKFISESDSRVRVRHYGKWYDAQLLKTGTHDYILKKAKFFQFGLSIDSNNEADSNKRLKCKSSLYNRKT